MVLYTVVVLLYYAYYLKCTHAFTVHFAQATGSFLTPPSVYVLVQEGNCRQTVLHVPVHSIKNIHFEQGFSTDQPTTIIFVKKVFITKL